jgi:hypothetical protein
MKKETILTLFMTVLLCSGLTGCGHTHEWQDATCTEPQTCAVCDKTEGSPLGHTWTVATCTAPKTCTVCGETEGTALAHTWVEATCTTPKTCTVCGETEGTALGHTWQDATCTTPKTCTVCGETEGELTEHDLNSTGKCLVCDQQVGYQLNLANYSQYITFSFEVEKDSSGKITGIVSKIQPIKNVAFYDVVITASTTINAQSINSYSTVNGQTGILQRNGQYLHKISDTISYNINVNEQGYGSYTGKPTIDTQNGITVTITDFLNGGITNISGYIVE